MKRLLITIFCFVLGLQSASADKVSVEIVDANGQPLVNAALLIDSERPNTQKDNEAIVDQVDRQFTPMVSAVEPGTDIVFPNSDNTRHNVYSFSDAKSFELKLYSDKEQPSVNFDQEGIVTLGCNIHDQMIAYVVVSDDYEIAVTNDRGIAEFNLSDGKEMPKVKVWHYWMGDELSRAQTVALISEAGKLTGQAQVSAPQQEKKEPSRLEQRFNRKGNQ